MLARRELSEAQVRQRLARLGHDDASVDTAVARLKEQRAIDDRRVAEALARIEATIRHRGQLRVRRRIEAAGIAAETAREAVERTFSGLDPDQLLDAALARRLRARTRIADDAEFRRLYRYLVAQGFEPDRVLARLRKARGGPQE
jgi:regulatory protein